MYKVTFELTSSLLLSRYGTTSKEDASSLFLDTWITSELQLFIMYVDLFAG